MEDTTVKFADETTALEEDDNPFKFRLDSLIDFIFPGTLQHPLAAGRLYVFGNNGPLDKKGQIRTGFKGSRVLAVYELEQMCMQSEREDILLIYAHKARDIGLMTSNDQFNIINQADAHLKRASGKASLPQITAKDIIALFDDVPKDEFGRISFHDAQETITNFRKDRIQQFKMIYPKIGGKDPKKSMGATQTTGSTLAGFGESVNGGHILDNGSTHTKSKKSGRMPLIGGKVSTAVAPRTMFQHKEGLSNPELVGQNTKYLNKYAAKISEIDSTSSAEMLSNIRLLREVPPFCKDPYEVKGEATRVKWDDECTMRGTGLGSMVKATASATTWKRKTTVY
jgi:hypothetical protein